MDNDADVVGVPEDVDLNEVLLLDSILELVIDLFDVLVAGKVDMLCVVGVDVFKDASKNDDVLETFVLIEVENKLKLEEVFDGATNILENKIVPSDVLVGTLDEELVNVLDEGLVNVFDEGLDEELVGIIDEELDSALNVEATADELLDMKICAETTLLPNKTDKSNRCIILVIDLFLYVFYFVLQDLDHIKT